MLSVNMVRLDGSSMIGHVNRIAPIGMATRKPTRTVASETGECRMILTCQRAVSAWPQNLEWEMMNQSAISLWMESCQ
jgi:hypothetical protein